MTPSSVSRMLSRRDFSSARFCAEPAAPELAHRVQFSFVLQVCSFARRQLPLQAAALVPRLKTARTCPRFDSMALTSGARLDARVSAHQMAPAFNDWAI